MADKARRLIEVEVVYALPRAQTVIAVRVPAGSNVGDAIEHSRIAEHHPEIDWDKAVTGVFGTRASLSTTLQPHDRVEIYRPLGADPRQARHMRLRRRAAR